MEELEKSMYYGANSMTFEKAKSLRQKMTLGEKLLWERLKGKKLFNLRFRRQHPINMYIVDFYCHAARLVIEIDGEIHKFQKDYDEARTEDLINFGLMILRFKNYEVEHHLDSVIEKIKHTIEPEL